MALYNKQVSVLLDDNTTANGTLQVVDQIANTITLHTVTFIGAAFTMQFPSLTIARAKIVTVTVVQQHLDQQQQQQQSFVNKSSRSPSTTSISTLEPIPEVSEEMENNPTIQLEMVSTFQHKEQQQQQPSPLKFNASHKRTTRPQSPPQSPQHAVEGTYHNTNEFSKRRKPRPQQSQQKPIQPYVVRDYSDFYVGGYSGFQC